jgi:hypothetical protein
MLSPFAQKISLRLLRSIAFLVTILISMMSLQTANAAESKGKSAGRVSTVDAELARFRADAIAKMKETRASTEKLLALHQEEVKKLTIEYQQRREFYNQGLISRAEVNEVERNLAKAILHVNEDKRWMAESDIAITEASMRDVLLRLPAMGPGAYSESASLIRFNGLASWSLADAGKIEKFFAQSFGHALPISAFGQTLTHDRLRFDHRNAMDVAVHPDSNEGRSLLAYLREAGIPFIAFRSAMPGAATGAHIHIGNPSLKTVAGADSSRTCCNR